MKTKEEILEGWGCPHVPFDENVKMFYPAILEAMDEYAKLHVKAALSAAAENSYCNHIPDHAHGCEYEVNKESILNSYPDESFK